MLKYPALYRIVRRKGATVAHMLSMSPLNVSFRRVLIGEKLGDWLSLVSLVLPVTLNDNKDEFVWLLKWNSNVSTQSLYTNIMEK